MKLISDIHISKEEYFSPENNRDLKLTKSGIAYNFMIKFFEDLADWLDYDLDFSICKENEL